LNSGYTVEDIVANLHFKPDRTILKGLKWWKENFKPLNYGTFNKEK
jgi:hypothetical protein